MGGRGEERQFSDRRLGGLEVKRDLRRALNPVHARRGQFQWKTVILYCHLLSQFKEKFYAHPTATEPPLQEYPQEGSLKGWDSACALDDR